MQPDTINCVSLIKPTAILPTSQLHLIKQQQKQGHMRTLMQCFCLDHFHNLYSCICADTGLDGSSEMISRCEDHHPRHGIISKRGSHPFRLYNARPHAGIQSVCTAPSLRQEQMNSEFRSKENAGLWLIWERPLLTMTASTTAEDRQNHSNNIFIHRWREV